MLKSKPVLLYDTPFIGRIDELKKIDAAVNAWGKTRVICLDGDGGIGKTRLLAEVYQRYIASSPGTLKLLDIIDFDDTSFHIPGKVEQHIVESLGSSKFDSYWRKTNDLRIMERHKVSAESLAHQKESIQKMFCEALNQYTVEKRMVLLFDTAEKQVIDETWENILSIISQTSNVFVLIAGRYAQQVWDKFQARLGEIVQVEMLEKLDDADSETYLAEKQKKMRISMSPELVKGLLLLADGHPILLDLAVEWVTRDLPASWIMEISQQKITTGDLRARKKEFEKLLVARIMDIRTPMDRLSLMLARIYPLDVPGLAELLKLDLPKAQILFDDAQTFVFIKRLPGKRISLHDEMRRMVNEHVWPEVDQSNERRTHESKLIAVYLKTKIAENTARLEKLETPQTSAKTEVSTQPVAANLLEISALERETWVYQGQYLEHLLYYSPADAVSEFVRIFNEDTRNNPREILVNAVTAQMEKLAELDRIEVISQQIKLLYDKGSFAEAIALGKKLNLDSFKPSIQMDLLNKLANSKLALGQIPEAVDDLQQSLMICETDSDAKKWIGHVYNLLGMAYRQMGHYREAARYYNLVLKGDRDSEDDENSGQEVKATSRAVLIQQAAALNNLGYVYGLEGRYRAAETFCKEGLAIREKIKLNFETGASLTTMGEIYRNWGKYQDALEYYNRALAIFEPENAVLWLARLYSYRGAVYRLMDEYKQAEHDLQRSIELNVPAEKPWACHVLGCVYWNRNELDKALVEFQTSEKLSKEAHDVRTHANNLVGSAEIYYIQWLENKDPVLLEKINRSGEKLTQILQEKYDFPHHLGRMQRVLGDVAFEQKRFEDAKKIYAKAYATLGRRTGGYGKRTFLDEVESLSQKIKQLAQENPREALKWCNYFLDYFTDETRPIMRRDELVSMCSVNKIELQLQLRA